MPAFLESNLERLQLAAVFHAQNLATPGDSITEERQCPDRNLKQVLYWGKPKGIKLRLIGQFPRAIERTRHSDDQATPKDEEGPANIKIDNENAARHQIIRHQRP